MSTFFISDTHFGHANILTFEAEHRPFASVEDMNEALVERWNSVVNPKDTVWHLGDVVFGQKNAWYLGRLNGQKKLVMGNHDQLNLKTYSDYFHRIYGCFSLHLTKEIKVILSHVPVHQDQFAHRFKANLHGHLHSRTLPDPRYINVSCEQNNLTPIPWEDIVARVEKLKDV